MAVAVGRFGAKEEAAAFVREGLARVGQHAFVHVRAEVDHKWVFLRALGTFRMLG